MTTLEELKRRAGISTKKITTLKELRNLIPKRINKRTEIVETVEETPPAAAAEHLIPSEYDNIILMDGRSRRKSEMRIYLEKGGMTDLALGRATQTSIAEEYGKTQSSVSRMVKQIKKTKMKRLQILAKIKKNNG